MLAEEVILRPIVTEASMDAMDENKYTFEVDRRANKIEVRQAIHELFGVDVVKVNIANLKPKPKRMGLYMGYTRHRRKAVVTIAEGQSIELFQSAESEE